MNADAKWRTRLQRYANGESIKEIAASERRGYGTVYASMTGGIRSFLRKVPEGALVPIRIEWLERWAEGEEVSPYVRRGVSRTYAHMARLTPLIAQWVLDYDPPLICPHCGQVVR